MPRKNPGFYPAVTPGVRGAMGYKNPSHKMGRKDLLEHMHTKHQLLWHLYLGLVTLVVCDIWLVERYAGWYFQVFFFENTYVFSCFFSIFPHFTIFTEVMIRMMWGSLFLWSARKTEKSWTLFVLTAFYCWWAPLESQLMAYWLPTPVVSYDYSRIH